MSWHIEDLTDSQTSQLKSEWINFFDHFVKITGLRLHRCHFKFEGFQSGGIYKVCKCGKDRIYRENDKEN